MGTYNDYAAISNRLGREQVLMAGLVESVRARVADESCICVTRCRARGCSVSMKDAHSSEINVLIKYGLPQPAEWRRRTRRCDFIFVSDDGDWVAALELKRGDLAHAS